MENATTSGKSGNKLSFERFQQRLSMKDFVELQAMRMLRRNETLVQYIFKQDALLKKSPHPLTHEERIAMIIGDIKDIFSLGLCPAVECCYSGWNPVR
ncbi:hypothetical protein HPB47_010878 [Ixodes persulcatus]|uniref:Uncharacterized protein n=1 Tax=Ixodes persulcatus TaxID=34615 RepID=A0AC60NY34_IXOPE|nr:hypothetical protein HPB47_010878 [Ixodes persulcatus]